MKEGPNIALIGSMLGDPARVNMLTALMSGKALTCSELAIEAGITIQTASSHVAKLESSGLINCRKQGRHRYFVIATDVARVIEAIMGLAASKGHLRTNTGPKDAALREARICYDHLAGSFGVHLFDSMINQSYLIENGIHIDITEKGKKFIKEFGICPDEIQKQRRPLCLSCLDWSARRSHLAGTLGSAILKHLFNLGWAEKTNGSRVIHFSNEGKINFYKKFL